VLEPDVVIETPAVSSSVPLIRDLVVHTCRSLGVDASVLDDVALAVTEAAANATVHAYSGGRYRYGVIRISVNVGREDVTIVVEDEGRGMGIEAIDPGAGLGLGIIGSVTENADLGPAQEGRGTSVRMAFARA
jgi:anti-sigma regulatory factor (Ser/Thr protein kinase)